MKILIIGNGFDLAHGLPTKYTDFLQICSIAKTARVTMHMQQYMLVLWDWKDQLKNTAMVQVPAMFSCLM